jgi:hypothetical protein
MCNAFHSAYTALELKSIAGRGGVAKLYIFPPLLVAIFLQRNF